MTRLTVTITNEESEILESFVVKHPNDDENQASFVVRDYLEHKFECEEDD